MAKWSAKTIKRSSVRQPDPDMYILFAILYLLRQTHGRGSHDQAVRAGHL